MLSRNQIKQKLRQAKVESSDLDASTILIPTKEPRDKAMVKIMAMFVVDGAKYDKSKTYSNTGHIQVGRTAIVPVPFKLDKVKIDRPLPTSNPAVKNRLLFGATIQTVLAQCAKPLKIEFVANGKRLVVTGVENILFEGKGTFDLKIITKGKNIPLSVMQPKGHYRVDVQDWVDTASMVLESAAIAETLDARMNGDKMVLNSPVATMATRDEVQSYLFDDIRGGFIIGGDFKDSDFTYNGRTNTLRVAAARLFTKASDIRSEDQPYFVIENSDRGVIGELTGLMINLTPKASLPNKTTIVSL